MPPSNTIEGCYFFLFRKNIYFCLSGESLQDFKKYKEFQSPKYTGEKGSAAFLLEALQNGSLVILKEVLLHPLVSPPNSTERLE